MSQELPVAVLWDMDGTIVDTEPYWLSAERELSESFGGTWDDALGYELIGQSLESSAPILRERAGIEMGDAEMIDALIERVRQRIQSDGAPWRPGARELLADLVARGVPNALVTMSYASLADAVIELLPAGTFQARVTGDTVTHGKPHPEPYLKAAELLGVNVRECVAIEDSPPGVTSAVASGAFTLAVVAHVPLEPGPGRVVLNSLEGLTALDLLAQR